MITTIRIGLSQICKRFFIMFMVNHHSFLHQDELTMTDIDNSNNGDVDGDNDNNDNRDNNDDYDINIDNN